MKIEDVEEIIFTDCDGRTLKRKVFKTKSDKKRASEIIKQLEGLTIREAQSLLKTISDVLIDCRML